MLTNYERQEDGELVKAAMDGSEKAWLCLVRRYEKRVFNYALRISHNREDAMDIMQDTFLAVYRNLQSWRGDGAFPAWLFRIAVFRATDLLRKRKMTTEHFEETSDHSTQSQPEASLMRDHDNQRIMDLMQKLSSDARQILELKFFQHFTFDEIAAQLGISSNTAKSRLYAAIQRMRQSQPGINQIENA